MARSSPVGRPPTALYEAVTFRLNAAEVLRCEEIFAGYEIKQDGRTYRVGHIIKAAWQAEDALPPTAAHEVADLLRAILDSTVSQRPTPACCRWHRLEIPSLFDDPLLYPNDNELLISVSRLVWILLPHFRGAVAMKSHPRPWVSASRFMLFDCFVKWHDRQLIEESRLPSDAITDYEYHFSPSQRGAYRRANLRKRLNNGEICGMIGARNENENIAGRAPHYCDQQWPFSTPSQSDNKAQMEPPDRELSRLGLEFSSAKRFVELRYRVEIGRRGATAAYEPALPSVIDAQGYWLFRPDRAAARNGVRWNHTRDLQTGKRGRRELIAIPSPISQLSDLIVWPKPTSGSWASVALPALAVDNVV